MEMGIDPLQHTSIYQRIKDDDSDDSDGEGGMGNVNRIIMRPPGHSGKAKRGHLCFDASFETGNLGRVDLVNEYEYDLFIRPDTCNPKHRFWFNFTVDNVRQDQRVIFNIVNMSRSRNLFNSNMTPIVKSTSRPKWQRIPKRNAFYQQSPMHKNNYILSFAFTFDKEDEVYQFALTFPYSYSRCQCFLTVLDKKTEHLQDYFKRETIAQSIQKRKLDLLTIGNDTGDEKEKRRVVFIIARIHPGESPTSLVCQGLIEFLISAHPMSNLLRERVLFKIIPMINPDGVFLGNYKSTLMGSNLNRCWNRASLFAHPTILATIDVLNAINRSKEYQLDFIIDLHVNATLLGCFIYGNGYNDVYRFERHIVLPKLLANVCDDFEAKNCMYNSETMKNGTARRYFCNTLNDKVNIYSFEVSLWGYKLKGSDVVLPYTEESYKRCGRNLIRALLEYYYVTGFLAMSLGHDIQEKRRPKTTRHHRRPRSASHSSRKSCTNRIAAPLHYKDINIYYDSETSDDERYIYTSRFSPKKFMEKYSDQLRHSETVRVSSPPPIIVMPEPCLTIIDFNKLTNDGIEKSLQTKKF